MSTGAARGLAEGLRRRGLAAPARLLLDAHRPLRPLLSESVAWLRPVLRTVLGGERYRALQTTLDDDRRFTELIEQLADAEHR